MIRAVVAPSADAGDAEEVVAAVVVNDLVGGAVDDQQMIVGGGIDFLGAGGGDHERRGDAVGEDQFGEGRHGSIHSVENGDGRGRRTNA